MKRTKRESARQKSSNPTNTVGLSNATKTVMPANPNDGTPSHAAKNPTPSLLEQAKEELSWEEVKILIDMSKGIGTPGGALQEFARSIVGRTDIETVDDNQRLETFGTTDRYFARGLVGQMMTAGAIGGDKTLTTGDGYDFIVAVLRGAKPKDQMAAMLATQIGVTHMAVIKFSARLARAEDMQLEDHYERALNKLLRTFIMQVEAYTRYQNGGEQKVRVQHVSVSEFGQAIVGNVTQGALDRPVETPALTELAASSDAAAQ